MGTRPEPLEQLTPYQACHALISLGYNESPLKLAQLLMPGRSSHYFEEWVGRFQRGIPYAVGRMDAETFRRFCDIAFENYGGTARVIHPRDAGQGAS